MRGGAVEAQRHEFQMIRAVRLDGFQTAGTAEQWPVCLGALILHPAVRAGERIEQALDVGMKCSKREIEIMPAIAQGSGVIGQGAASQKDECKNKSGLFHRLNPSPAYRCWPSSAPSGGRRRRSNIVP